MDIAAGNKYYVSPPKMLLANATDYTSLQISLVRFYSNSECHESHHLK